MSFGKETILLVLRNKSLEFVNDQGESRSIELAPTIFNYGEVISSELFSKTIKEFLTKEEINGYIILALDSTLIIERDFSKNTTTDAEITAFLEMIPFQEVLSVKYIVGESLRISCANGLLITTLKKIFLEHGAQLKSVVALNHLIENTNQITDQEYKKIIAHDKENNFLESKNEEKKTIQIESSTDEKKSFNNSENTSKKNVLLIIVFIIIICIAGGIVVLNLFPKSNVQQNESIVAPSVIPTIIQESSPSPVPIVAEKSTFTVQVLNGSGITGEAAKTSTVLENIGFSQLETGNTVKTTETTIVFKSNVPLAYRDEIIAEVSKLYTEVKSSDSESNNFDIVITIGN